jgi:signal transduction histidine kinase
VLAAGLALLALSRSVVSYDLEGAKQRMLGNPTAVARVEHAQATLSTEVQGLRELMASLRPRPWTRSGWRWPYATTWAPSPAAALLNVARHAEAGRIWLELEGAGDRVDLEIGDDGVGFEPVTGASLVRQGHFGLVAMQERVEMAGGRFQLDTRPGAGVVLRAEFRVPRRPSRRRPPPRTVHQ